MSVKMSLYKQHENRSVKVYKWDIVWSNVILLTLVHLAALYALIFERFYVEWKSTLFFKTIGLLSSLGVTGGAHRLWAHRSYKANTLVQIMLLCMMSMTYHKSVYNWCRDHRVHHKYTETDADPHNAKRGFFFSHMGWLCVRKHKDVIEKGVNVDLSDLENNRLIMFQHKYYIFFILFFAVGLTTFVPWIFWDETLVRTFFLGTIYRYIITVHLTWCINSIAHLYGNKPYNKNIGPVENKFAMSVILGEGFHNYHHTFPNDYKAAEMGNDTRNLTTYMIDMFAWFGWVTDRRTASQNMINNTIAKTGDGSYRTETAFNLHSNAPKSVLRNLQDAVVLVAFIHYMM